MSYAIFFAGLMVGCFLGLLLAALLGAAGAAARDEEFRAPQEDKDARRLP